MFYDNEARLLLARERIDLLASEMEAGSRPDPPGGPAGELGTRATVIAGLDRATSIAVGADGALYVTNHGLSAGGGEVLRVEP